MFSFLTPHRRWNLPKWREGLSQWVSECRLQWTLAFCAAGEKQQRELTVYWLFNIYWIVTITRDRGYSWTGTVFSEKILKSYTKLCLLLWAHASSIEPGKQSHPLSSPPPFSHAAIFKKGNLVPDNQQSRSFYLLVNQDFKKHRFNKDINSSTS